MHACIDFAWAQLFTRLNAGTSFVNVFACHVSLVPHGGNLNGWPQVFATSRAQAWRGKSAVKSASVGPLLRPHFLLLPPPPPRSPGLFSFQLWPDLVVVLFLSLQSHRRPPLFLLPFLRGACGCSSVRSISRDAWLQPCRLFSSICRKVENRRLRRRTPRPTTTTTTTLTRLHQSLPPPLLFLRDLRRHAESQKAADANVSLE